MDFTVVFSFIGFLVCYVSIFADYMLVFIITINNNWFIRPMLLMIAMGVVLIPLTLLRSIDALVKISFLATLIIIAAVISTVIMFIIT